MSSDEPLVHLDEIERRCVQRYIASLTSRLRGNLVEVWLFGSAARGDMWSARLPMHSDIDVLALTERPVADPLQEELVNETYGLFLECGRQIAPTFKVATEFHHSTEAKLQAFRQRVWEEGRRLFP
ncbi:MAG TPA: nucleotidyltransferase domain-containing protein [Candidatus Kryptonia bacterium]|nr:nucleotidyltransferase domain-containing protein [Candidatus Kryptonia bacterium]